MEQGRPWRKPRPGYQEDNLEMKRQRTTDHKGEGGTEMGAASTKEALGGKGKAVPSPEDVEADVALEVNVGMINHCLTLHLGGVMWVTLSHLAPEKEKCRFFGLCIISCCCFSTEPPLSTRDSP